MAESVEAVEGVDYGFALSRIRRLVAKLMLASDQRPLRFLYPLRKLCVFRLKDRLQIQISPETISCGKWSEIYADFQR
jgi:hypothetical protein